jgi:hypothetical protein
MAARRKKTMKSLSVVESLFRSREPLVSSVKIRVASVLNVFIAIRGLQALLDRDTAIVMRKGYETFVTQDAAKIGNDKTLLAVVYLKDLNCHKRLKTVQTDHFFHRNTLNRIILDDLADETTKQLLKEAEKLALETRQR